MKDLIRIEEELEQLKQSDVERLKAFRDNPSDESWIRG